MEREFTHTFFSHNLEARRKYPTNTVGRFQCEIPMGRGALQGWLMSVLKITMLTRLQPSFIVGFFLDGVRVEYDLYKATDKNIMVKYGIEMMKIPRFAGKAKIEKVPGSTNTFQLLADELPNNRNHTITMDRAFAALIGVKTDEWVPGEMVFRKKIEFGYGTPISVDRAKPSRICFLHSNLGNEFAPQPNPIESFVLPEFGDRPGLHQPAQRQRAGRPGR